MNSLKNLYYLFLSVSWSFVVATEQPIHNSIYNTPSSSNAIYNQNNLFTEPESFSDALNGHEDDLDVEDHDDDYEDDDLEEGDNFRHNSLLQIAIDDHDIITVQNIIKDKKIDINYQNKDGRTALHCAAAENADIITRLLLEHGALCDIADFQGWTPLHVAVDANAFAVVKILMEYHANMNAKNTEDKTPQDYATNDAMKLLLQGHAI